MCPDSEECLDDVDEEDEDEEEEEMDEVGEGGLSNDGMGETSYFSLVICGVPVSLPLCKTRALNHIGGGFDVSNVFAGVESF